jgi:hypothetical protein
MKSSVGVNSRGRSIEKVKMLLNGSHLEAQAVRLQHHHGDDRSKRNTKPTFLVYQMSKWFDDTSTGTAPK